MERKPLSPPDQSNYQLALEQALKIAIKKLADADIEAQCRKAGAELKLASGKKSIVLDYLNQSYRITLPGLEVTPLDHQTALQPREKLLILHYIINADGSPISGNKLTYKEIPGGTTYFPTFQKRTVKPLVDNFGQEPQRMLDAAGTLGGCPAEYGDASVTINAFERVPLTFVLWQGDEEFAAEGNVLFDSSICGYLPAEDITVLCEIIAWKLVKTARYTKEG